MPILPSLLLLLIILIFLYDFLDSKVLITVVCSSILGIAVVALRSHTIAPLRALSIKRHLINVNNRDSCTASAIVLTSPSDDGWNGSKLSYERLSNFSETLASLGVPVAYVSFFYPSNTFGSRGPSISRAFLMVWSNGKERGNRRPADYMSQLEGICEIALPGVNAKKMNDRDLSCLLNYPLHIAVTKLVKPLDHIKNRVEPAPLLPPPQSKDPSDVFPFPEPDAISGDGPLLGMVQSNGKDVAPLALYLKDIQRHVSIFGTTGSGKSTTAISLALRLFSMGISILILDWHGEHTRVVRAAGGKVYSPGSAENGLTINPMYCPNMKEMDFQIEFVTDIFSQIFQFTPPQAYMFREALRSSLKLKANPAISDLIRELSLIPIRSSWDHETRMALMRRLKIFTEGTCGMALDGKDSFFREEIFRGLVSIDLSNLKDVNSRTIFSNFVLKIVYDHAVNNEAQERLKHVLIIEEAQNIIPPRRPDAPRTVGERILGELRKFGEGVVVISQFPSSISNEVIKNTSIRIIHTVRSGEDLEVLVNSMSLDDRQREALTLLSTGEAVVNLPYRSSNLLVKISPDPILSDFDSKTVAPLSYLPSPAS
ncbi:MAG: ATP-binding protein [Candidatus Methanomethyliaceae archaeon]|nr:ATP-binding protein [Candidatus Methanomethyliaceae archaeon]